LNNYEGKGVLRVVYERTFGGDNEGN
jgi:hypothetical protein